MVVPPYSHSALAFRIVSVNFSSSLFFFRHLSAVSLLLFSSLFVFVHLSSPLWSVRPFFAHRRSSSLVSVRSLSLVVALRRSSPPLRRASLLFIAFLSLRRRLSFFISLPFPVFVHLSPSSLVLLASSFSISLPHPFFFRSSTSPLPLLSSYFFFLPPFLLLSSSVPPPSIVLS